MFATARATASRRRRGRRRPPVPEVVVLGLRDETGRALYPRMCGLFAGGTHAFSPRVPCDGLAEEDLLTTNTHELLLLRGR